MKTKTKGITANEISKELTQYLSRPGQVVMTNTFPAGYGFECDVLRVLKSFHWTEYEIKTSVADFRKDFLKKTYEHVRAEGEPRPGEIRHGNYERVETKKHDHLSCVLRSQSGPKPKQFYFVMPEGMVPLEEVPGHCGVLWVKEDGDLSKRQWIVNGRKAPILKGHAKMTPAQLFNLLLKK